MSEDTCEVGSHESPESKSQFESIECAVAGFIVRELDHRQAVEDRRRCHRLSAAKASAFEIDNQSSQPRNR